MKFRRIFTPAVLIVTLLVQFLPGTVFAPRPVAASVACDAAQFVADVTIPDGTSFAPGAALIKTWRFKNIGTCTWSTSYAIVFYSGTKMGAPSAVNMPTSVAPGATVDVTVNMTAPTTAGHYRGNWMLRNASSVLFGVGPYGTYWFFIDIVVSAGYSTATYDFVANYCSAIWTSGAGTLPCPGTDGSASGYVINSAAPKLEDGSTDTTPGLFVGPQNVTDGYISGTYPAFTVQSGDRFQSIVSCAYGVPSCYVTFQLNYQIGSGPVYTFWQFREKTEGLYYRASVNLSSLAGQSVKFTLKVMASGSPTGDRVLWGGARIARLGGPTPPPVSTCDKAAFVTDVTIPDGTGLTGGTPFTKTWRLQNVGTCTWTTSYRLVFAGGDYMGASASAFNLPTSVVPGGSIDLSVNLAAPISAGNFIGYWKLRNASGTNFGVGASGTSAFLVNINVISSYGSAYDFVTNANSATWSSGAGALPWPGTDGDVRGFVLPLGSHQMEDGISSPEGLLTFPQYVTDGYIQGIYPGFTVQSGDHFQSYIGCQYGGPSNCYIVFRLSYQIGSGPVYTLKTAAERLEGLVYRMDVDLSALAGSNVKFILKVEAFGSPSGDRAVWSAPRIVRSGIVPPGPTSTTTTITADAPDPSTPGQSVAVSVTVSGAGTTPTGTVAITGADTNCTLTLSGGSGSCNVIFNTTGAKTLTATYSGDVNYTGSSDTESHTVSTASAATTTTITADAPDPSTPGQSVAVSVTVSGAGTTPTGTVAITGADINCTITLSSGSGSCNVVFNTIGGKTLTATYSGDVNYTGSSDTESHTVSTVLASSITTVTGDVPDSSTPGQSVVVGVTVSGTGATPTGTVVIIGADTNCTITLAGGSGSCNVVFNTTGAKTLTATYSGDSNYASSSDTESHTVSQGPSTTIITADAPDPSTPGQSVAMSVTVSGAGTTPTGMVIITGADTNCTITLSSGSGSCNVVLNTVGSWTLTATYSGDMNYVGSSDTASHTVNQGPSTTTITADLPDPSAAGGTVPVTATVSGAGATPTGTVTIAGADAPCTITLIGGSGSCNVVFSATGVFTLTATYSGDANYTISSDTESHTVN